MSQIRAALVCDIPGIISVLNENLIKTNLADAQAADLEARGFLVYGFTPEELKLTIIDTQNIVMVMEEDAQILGYTLSYDLRSLAPTWIEPCTASRAIKELLLTQKVLYYRHIAKLKGIKNFGNSMMQALIATAQQKGYQYIVAHIVHTPIANEVSIKFHERHGFRQVGLLDEDNLLLGVYLKELS